MIHIKRYPAYRFLALALVTFYASVVILVRIHDHFHHQWTEELFPFFNWSLFSISASERSVSTLRLDSVNEKPLLSSRLYYDMDETFAYAKQRDSTVWKATENLADAIKRDDTGMISQMRKVIEERYMAEIKSAEYDVVQLTYDPIKRLQTGEIKDTVVLGTFRKVPHD
jgi:hypothetical protein